MATQYVYAAAVPNRTLTAKLYNLSLVLQNTAVTTAEDIANTGVYLCTFVEPTAYDGIFRIILTDDATGLGVATWQAVQRQRSHLAAVQAFNAVADGGQHALNLVVFAFCQCEAQAALASLLSRKGRHWLGAVI